VTIIAAGTLRLTGQQVKSLTGFYVGALFLAETTLLWPDSPDVLSDGRARHHVAL